MSSGSDSQDRRAPKRPRFTLQVPFKSVEEKEAFVRRFDSVCKLLKPAGAPPLDNHGVMSAMFDAVERSVHEFLPRDTREHSQSFMSNNGEYYDNIVLHASFITKGCLGVYVGDDCPEDQGMFITEKCCFTDLLHGLSCPCLCGLTMKPWKLESFTQVSVHEYNRSIHDQ